MTNESRDVASPPWGPAFLRFTAWPYRLEMAMFTIGLIVVLIGWRLFVARDLDLLSTIFWMIWPDLAAFFPIGIAARGGKGWPSWGPALYNVTHTFVVAVPVIALWSFFAGGIAWPLLGWVGHITADRSVGYYLRSRPSSTSAP